MPEVEDVAGAEDEEAVAVEEADRRKVLLAADLEVLAKVLHHSCAFWKTQKG